MKYNELINKVLIFAYKAHDGHVDKSGVPYIFHPYHLAEEMDTEEEIITALLHDVMEDTSYGREDIKKLGVGENILEALELLTHDKKMPYMDYIDSLKGNSLARKIKLADLRHNSDESRLEAENEATIKRRKKYADSIKLLLDYESSLNNIK